MYAENLGSIPPNTGLLIIHDGDDMYQIRFCRRSAKKICNYFTKKKELKFFNDLW